MKRIIKRVVALLIAIMICGGSISWNAFITKAATIKYSGTDGDLTWSIDSEGHLLVEGTGDRENASATLPAWNEYWFEIKSATINVSEITDVHYFFHYCLYLTSVDLSGFDTSSVTDMSWMFSYCESLTTLDLSGFNTRNVTNMREMFQFCKLITILDLSSFDMENVTSTSGMFNGCSSLVSINTPKNLNIDTDIPVDISYSWFLDDMTRMCMGLPIGETESFVLNRINAENSKQPDVGDGSVEVPYEIDEASELIWFAETVNDGNTGINGILTADIDINPGYTFASDGTFEKISETNHFTKWIPIGTDDATYTGVFDGQNHTIKGIYYDNFGRWSDAQDSQVGLFGEAGTSSIIRNITLDNGYISAKEKVGAICGNSAGSIEGCVNNVPVVSSGSYIGGVCGQCENVVECANIATVLGNGDSSSFVGGIVGEGKNITRCYNTGSVKGVYEIGGIGGLVAYNASLVSDNYNTGNVEASGESACAGGIIGLFDGSDSVLQNCFNAGVITNENSYSCAIVGTPYGECINNFYLADSETDSRDGTTYKTASKFASGEVAYLLQSAQTGTDVVWGQLIGKDAYPVLEGTKVYNVENCNGGQYSNSSESEAHNFTDGVCVVCGEAENVKLSGYSISLTGNIAINFYMQLSEKILKDSSAYMLFTFADGDTSKVQVSDANLKTEDNKTYYVLTCEVQAPEINDEFTAQIITATCKTEIYTYSVKTYADYILAYSGENEDYAKAAPMVRAMLNYGGYSQLQFKYMKKKETKGLGKTVKTKDIAEQNTGCRSLDAMADKIIIELLSQKNVDKFRKLYLDGDISDYHSESEADEALCGIIAYRTDEVKLIDAVFRKSRLYRDKWNRRDYRDKTIRNAIERKQKKIKKERPPFIMVETRGSDENAVEVETVSATRLARYIRDNVDYIMVKDNANQETMTYVYQNGYYQLHDDNMLKGLIRKQISDYNEDLVQMKTVKEVVENLKAETSYVHRSNLNSEEKIINFQNGILRVTEDSLVLEQHTPDIYSTIQIPSNWTGEAKPTPIFDNYIKTLTNDNREVQQLLMEFMGVCISNVKGWRMKKSLFLVGEGDSGKSLLKSLAERLLGLDNFISTDLKDIESRFGTSAVYGKRLAGSSDMSFLSVDELKAFKRLTGGDSVFTEYKGKQGFQQTYNGVLWFCMNQLPRFGGDNGKWVYERIMVVNCPNTIPLDKQDKELLEKMYAEREGIIYKAVRALQTVLKNGYRYSEPKSVIDARSEYHNTNSTVITFFQECMCRFDSDNVFDDKFKSGIVYKVYREWCKDNNNGYAKTEKEFRDELSKYLGTKYDGITKRVRGYTYYKDYGITKDVKRMYENKVL